LDLAFAVEGQNAPLQQHLLGVALEEGIDPFGLAACLVEVADLGSVGID
jgi:hypothetical protein